MENGASVKANKASQLNAPGAEVITYAWKKKKKERKKEENKNE